MPRRPPGGGRGRRVRVGSQRQGGARPQGGGFCAAGGDRGDGATLGGGEREGLARKYGRQRADQVAVPSGAYQAAGPGPAQHGRVPQDGGGAADRRVLRGCPRSTPPRASERREQNWPPTSPDPTLSPHHHHHHLPTFSGTFPAHIMFPALRRDGDFSVSVFGAVGAAAGAPRHKISVIATAVIADPATAPPTTELATGAHDTASSCRRGLYAVGRLGPTASAHNRDQLACLASDSGRPLEPSNSHSLQSTTLRKRDDCCQFWKHS